MNNSKLIKENYQLKDQLLHLIIDKNGSDLYLTVGEYPAIKINGNITKINEGFKKLKENDTEEFSQSLITEEQYKKLLQFKNIDFAFNFLGRRFRGNISFQMGNYMIVLRLLWDKIPTIDGLGLPDIYKEISKKSKGLILVTGPIGSGKSTTIAAMINYINENYSKHIITIEDPVEYIHYNKKSIIEQKELFVDVLDYTTGLSQVIRQASDVVLFGEIKSAKEIEAALNLVDSGNLVFSTLYTTNAYQTIKKIINSFESFNQNQISLKLADSLIGVFSQRLLKKSDGSGLKLAKEILIQNEAISNIIKQNDLQKLPSLMQVSIREGMQVIEKDIIDLINNGFISLEEGLKYADNPKTIKDTVIN